MKEKEFIKTISNILNSEYIGDDCAYLKEFGIVISQDNLVEDVHFKREYITPFQLGYKSAMVNISDICASGAKPLYLTIALSLPENINNDFIKEFYNGVQSACDTAYYKNSIKIVGGDITSADKIFISVCAIGDAKKRNISSRKYAKEGYKVVVSGLHGSSCAGLKLLLNGEKRPEKYIKAHLEPKAQFQFSHDIATYTKISNFEYAMMDTSDGLIDALSTIANESGVLLEIDFNKIPRDKDLENFANWQEMVLFGGEDYGLAAVIPQYIDLGTTIGFAKKGLGVDLIINNENKQRIHYSKKDVENKIFDHFK